MIRIILFSLSFLIFAANPAKTNLRCSINDEIVYRDFRHQISNTTPRKSNENSKMKLSPTLLKAVKSDLIEIYRDPNTDQILAVIPCCDNADVAIFRKYYYPYTIFNNNSLSLNFPTLKMTNKQLIKYKIEYANEIDPKYFMTKRGLRLGMSTAEVIQNYGEPDSISVLQNKPKIIRYKWEIYGKREAGALQKDLHQKVPESKICENIEWGTDYYVDFMQVKSKYEAVLIYIEPHPV